MHVYDLPTQFWPFLVVLQLMCKYCFPCLMLDINDAHKVLSVDTTCVHSHQVDT